MARNTPPQNNEAAEQPPMGQASGNSATEANAQTGAVLGRASDTGYSRRLRLGEPVYITDRDTGIVHIATPTHVNEDQSAVCTVFKPHETVVGVGFAPAVGNLASPGCWHYPE